MISELEKFIGGLKITLVLIIIVSAFVIIIKLT